jgi:hypothetical protein
MLFQEVHLIACAALAKRFAVRPIEVVESVRRQTQIEPPSTYHRPA